MLAFITMFRLRMVAAAALHSDPPPDSFLVLTNGRSGSTTFVNLLNVAGDKQLYLAPEWLWHGNSLRVAKELQLPCQTELVCLAHCLEPILDHFWAEQPAGRTNGMTVFPGHLFGHNVSALIGHAQRFIVLERGNKTAEFNSLVKAYRTGVWHSATELDIKQSTMDAVRSEFVGHRRFMQVAASISSDSRCRWFEPSSAANFDFAYAQRLRAYHAQVMSSGNGNAGANEQQPPRRDRRADENDPTTPSKLPIILKMTAAEYAAAITAWYTHVRTTLERHQVPHLYIRSEDLWAQPNEWIGRAIQFLASDTTSEKH